MPGPEICWKAKINQATYLNWRNNPSGLLSDKTCRLKALKDENSWLKKIAADMTAARYMLQDGIRRKRKTCPDVQAHRRYAGGFGDIDPQGL